jgi:MFS family permease
MIQVSYSHPDFLVDAVFTEPDDIKHGWSRGWSGNQQSPRRASWPWKSQLGCSFLSVCFPSSVGCLKSSFNKIHFTFSLTQGTFVLVSGRLGAVYGHRHVLITGAVWFVICTLGNGFCTSFVSFNMARALSGIGGALIMPNAVALISTAIPPGRLRNITLGFFGASAPIGSYIGAIWAGGFVQYASWNWIFFSLYVA